MTLKLVRIVFFPILYLLSIIYLLVIWVRSFLFDKFIIKPKRLSKPVISVGNISVGGSGKTALVLELLKHLPNYCVLTRGYGSQASKSEKLPVLVTDPNNTKFYGDEPCLIKQKHPSHMVVIDPNRYRGAEFSLSQDLKPSGFILDDGFQHRFLYRDFNILLFDLNAYKNKRAILPLGRFREGIKALKRADHVLLTKWKHEDKSFCEATYKHLNQFNSNIEFLDSNIETVNNHKGLKLLNQSVILVSGLGQPDVFEQDFRAKAPLNKIEDHMKYPDHYSFKQTELDLIVNRARKIHGVIVCTEKDYIKIKQLKIDLNIVYFTTQTLILSELLLNRISKYSSS